MLLDWLIRERLWGESNNKVGDDLLGSSSSRGDGLVVGGRPGACCCGSRGGVCCPNLVPDSHRESSNTVIPNINKAVDAADTKERRVVCSHFAGNCRFPMEMQITLIHAEPTQSIHPRWYMAAATKADLSQHHFPLQVPNLWSPLPQRRPRC